jgi:hypothetical protein
MKIFVSVASYRDRELPKTVKSVFDNAKYSSNLKISVLSQELGGSHPDLSFIPEKNLQYNKMHMKDARGAGYARKVISEMYNGEEFFFQIDSHMRFEKNWDVRLLTMMEKAKSKAKTEKIILSQYPAPYRIFTNGKEFYPKDDQYYWSDPSWTSVVYTYKGEWAGNREAIEDFSVPHKSHAILAGYMFAQGSLIEEVPYDDRISFMGEELCFSIRAYTRGWEIYAPNEMLAYHFYVRNEHPKIWNQRDDMARPVKWRDIEDKSKELQKSILLGKEKGVYGISSRKRYNEYQKMIGINFKNFYEGVDYGKRR